MFLSRFTKRNVSPPEEQSRPLCEAAATTLPEEDGGSRKQALLRGSLQQQRRGAATRPLGLSDVHLCRADDMLTIRKQHISIPNSEKPHWACLGYPPDPLPHAASASRWSTSVRMGRAIPRPCKGTVSPNSRSFARCCLSVVLRTSVSNLERLCC